ncbi:hypothetical protein CEP54_014478 [Fusarium duplospermum]|uniref:Heterokaryon incompatibility domain-containing protein n=1 Tax=Fusarium duplospermum TaxID=1325734 RepID=A0A428NW41_9HYPO|nr:hypothetical protein CEP54_014478 [Fusarium duplospermum]
MDGWYRSLRKAFQYETRETENAPKVQESMFPAETEGSAYRPWALGQEMYSDLAPGQVRLLHLSSSSTNAETPYLEFTLTSHYLRDVPTYTAVSYTWKEEDFYWYDAMDTKLLEIRLNGARLSAASKLAFMIKTLVKDYTFRWSYLWIDAICINQTDKKELGHQVGLMGDIYSQALAVVIFFGTPSRYTDAAMDLLSSPDMLSRAISVDASVGIIELMEHPYWFRGWIIQEVARCDTVALFCGRKIIDWRLLMTLFDHYQFKPLLRHQRPGSMLPAHQIQAIDSFRQEHSNHLVQVLQSTRAALTTDPRDSVFAKLGLALDSHSLIPEPDYSLGVEDVFKRLAAAHISRYGCLYLICLTEDSSYNLPSWVPDWSKTSGRLALQPSLVSHLNGKGASGGSAGFSPDLSVLFVRGTHIDTIAPFDKELTATLSVDACKDNIGRSEDVDCLDNLEKAAHGDSERSAGIGS